MPSLGPRGRGHRENTAAVSTSSSMLSARMIPCWRKNPSMAASLPAMAPVWDLAATMPRSERPTFRRMMGIRLRAASRAISAMRPGSRKPSMNPVMIRVRLSWMR